MKYTIILTLVAYLTTGMSANPQSKSATHIHIYECLYQNIENSLRLLSMLKASNSGITRSETERIFMGIQKARDSLHLLEAELTIPEKLADIYVLQAIFGMKYGIISQAEGMDILADASLIAPRNAKIAYATAASMIELHPNHGDFKDDFIFDVIGFLNKSIKQKGAFPEAYFLRSEMYAELGKLQDSIADKELFLQYSSELDPIIGLFDISRPERIEQMKKLYENQIIQYHNK